MQHWYVYYKLPRSEREAVIERVRRVQAQVERSTRVCGRLLERTEQSETTTMMEVYEGIDQPERFGAALEAVVRASGLPASLIAARRVERFQDT